MMKRGPKLGSHRTPIETRFSELFLIDDGCWLWIGRRNSGGYGQFRDHHGPVAAHRRMWMTFRGPIPPGLCVLHHCDTPLCVRLDHLWLGTQRDNVQDMIRKGRRVKRGMKK